ncbi:MAG: oligoendopeptidase F [bacterium]|nr:oligoendopeptidase F [bacterium]
MIKKSIRRLVCVLFLALMVFPLQPVQARERSQNRDLIAAKYKWNFSDIYANWQEWEKGFRQLEEKMGQAASFKGTLAKGPEHLLKVFKWQESLGRLASKVYRYPQLKRDTDTRNQEVAGYFQRVAILFSKYGVATSWINPEMLKIPWATMRKWLDGSPGFAPYRFSISDLYRQQSHVLDEEKEALLSYYTRLRGTPNSIYGELSTSDITFPPVKLSDGKEMPATSGNYSRVLATYKKQEDRKKIFEAHYKVYNGLQNTYAAIYQAVCQKDWAVARSRNYKSALEASLEANNIPVEVYKNLVKTAKANTEPLRRYSRLRKKILGLKKYHNYDGSIPITNFSKAYPYEQAKEWVLASVAPLGKDYVEKLKKALASGWIDVYENAGKRGGAYSAGVYGVHPFMLMNYNDTLRSVFTLAHELGHTIHSLLAGENQPYATHGYTLFVAEVTSTFNERLLLDWLLARTKNPKERIAFIQQAINGLTTTFYFQVLLADFEMQVHTLVEQGKPVTAKVLNQIMKDLFKAYWGDEIEDDGLVQVVWARIGHMYRTPFYVYQYATCFASSAQLYKAVTTGTKKERKAALERYLELQKSGGSDYPMEQLKKAGVDLTKPETVEAVSQQLDKLVTQLEKEIAKLETKP